MTTQSLRFLCTGGFHLHDVLGGIAEAPESLQELLANAPYRAAEQVIGAAVQEEVDFLLVTGDLLDAASGGPRAVAFLRDQFHVLHRHGIAVYWAASQLDLSTDWLEHVDFPPNVHVLSDDTVQQHPIVVSDRPSAVVLGRSWNALRPLRSSELSITSEDTPYLAVVPGSCELDGLPAQISFCAAGGSHAAITRQVGKQIIHCAGWPQGFQPQHTGAHGCTMVHIDSAGDLRTRRIETDVVRWAQERIEVPENAPLADVRSGLRHRIQKLVAESERVVLVQWTLAGDGWFNGPLVHPHRRSELLEWLRNEFGASTRPAWSLALEIEPPERLRDEWTDEDSILGDYLRTAREFLEDEAKSLVLEPPVAARHLPSEFHGVLSLENASVRSRALREAALIGAGMLRGSDRTGDVGSMTGREWESET